MNTTDIAAILAAMKTKPGYITQETIYGYGEPILPSEYLPNGVPSFSPVYVCATKPDKL